MPYSLAVCRSLAQDYEIPKSYLETNQIATSKSNYVSRSVDNKIPSARPRPLTKRQHKLVQKNPGSIVAVAQGALLAIKECQYQFQNRRWNCPTKDSNLGGPTFGKILNVGKFTR